LFYTKYFISRTLTSDKKAFAPGTRSCMFGVEYSGNQHKYNYLTKEQLLLYDYILNIFIVIIKIKNYPWEVRHFLNFPFLGLPSFTYNYCNISLYFCSNYSSQKQWFSLFDHCVLIPTWIKNECLVLMYSPYISFNAKLSFLTLYFLIISYLFCLLKRGWSSFTTKGAPPCMCCTISSAENQNLKWCANPYKSTPDSISLQFCGVGFRRGKLMFPWTEFNLLELRCFAHPEL